MSRMIMRMRMRMSRVLLPLRRRGAHRALLRPKLDIRALLGPNNLHRQLSSLSPIRALPSLSTELESRSTAIASELGDEEDVGIGGVGSKGDY